MNANTWMRLALCCLSGLPMIGCVVDGDSASMAIIGNVVPKREGTTCAYKEAETYYQSGTLDLAVASEYVFAPFVHNLLPPTQNINGNSQSNLRQETNIISLEKAVFTFEPSTSNSKTPFAESGINTPPRLVREWEVPVQFTLQPGEKVVLPIDAIPRQVKSLTGSGYVQLGADWQARFGKFKDRYKYKLQGVLHVQIVGETAGGSEVASTKFSYPLTLCWGCLLFSTSLTPNGEEPEDQWRQCSNMNVPADYEAPCSPGQDDALICGLGCKICKQNESLNISTCDPLFCPASE